MRDLFLEKKKHVMRVWTPSAFPNDRNTRRPTESFAAVTGRTWEK